MKKKIIILGIVIGILLLSGCKGFILSEADYRINNVKIFRDTPAWQLAKSVNRQNVDLIEKYAKNSPELLNYQEPKFGVTLLIWAINMEKYQSAEALLKCGADPNIICRWSGETALYRAASYSWVDNSAKEDPKYVKLLLEYGADPNICFTGHEKNNSPEIGTSPLMNSIACGIEKTKALVEGGAEINYQTKSGDTAANVALSCGGGNVLLERREYAYYLVVEKKADVTKPYYHSYVYQHDDPNEQFQPVGLLRYWVTDLDSEDYKIKMEIVDEFARQGINYWETQIPMGPMEQIQRRYPDTWQEYIKIY